MFINGRLAIMQANAAAAEAGQDGELGEADAAVAAAMQDLERDLLGLFDGNVHDEGQQQGEREQQVPGDWDGDDPDDIDIRADVGDMAPTNTTIQHASAAEYIQHANDPLFPASRTTVKQYCFNMMELKRRGKMKTGTMDIMLRLVSQSVLPAGNYAPPSYYLVKRVLGIRSPFEFEHHVCVNDHMVFPDKAKAQWSMEDKCAECGEPRFELTKQNNPVPRKVM